MALRLIAAVLLLSPPALQAAVFPPLSPLPDASAWSAACNVSRSAITCACMTHNLQRSGEGQFVLEREALKVRGSTDTEAALMARHGVPPEPVKKLTKAAKESAKEALAACR